MKFILVFLSLFVFEVSLGQGEVQVPVESKDNGIGHNCPQDPDMATVKDMIETYIEAEKLSQTWPMLSTKKCLSEPLPYKIVIPEPVINDNSHFLEPFFISSHKIEHIRKTGSSSYSDKYSVDVEIKGKDMSGNSVKFVDRAFFRINKGEEAELHGCVWLYGGWKRPFIYERCYNNAL